MNKENLRKSPVLALAAALFSCGLLWAGEAAPGSSAPVQPDAKKLYKANCALCHGAQAQGNNAMAKMYKVAPAIMNLSGGDAVGKTEAELIKIITDGKGKMIPYKKKLAKDQIEALAHHLVTLRPPKAEVKTEAKTEAKAETKPEAKSETKP